MEKKDVKFHFPVLIYDNYCSSCYKFANVIYNLSKKKIEILGHFDIERSTELKELVFNNYSKDPTRMFWYVKRDKAYASRKGLVQVIIDLIKINLGLTKYKNVPLVDQKFSKSCYIRNNFYSQYGCGDNTKSVLKRISYLIRNTDSIRWNA
jgi:predicted DCC family thiol-disulfide oxidoreductase YuxK